MLLKVALSTITLTQEPAVEIQQNYLLESPYRYIWYRLVQAKLPYFMENKSWRSNVSHRYCVK